MVRARRGGGPRRGIRVRGGGEGVVGGGIVRGSQTHVVGETKRVRRPLDVHFCDVVVLASSRCSVAVPACPPCLICC